MYPTCFPFLCLKCVSFWLLLSQQGLQIFILRLDFCSWHILKLYSKLHILGMRCQKLIERWIHPSLFFTLFFFLGCRTAGAYLHQSLCKRWSSPSQGHVETNKTISLTCMFVVCGKKPEYQEKTHPRKRICKLHPEKLGGKPVTFSLTTFLLWHS